MGKARCSTTLTYIKTTPLYKATVDTARALGISADNYAKVLQDCAILTVVHWNVEDVWACCCWDRTFNYYVLADIAHYIDGVPSPYPEHHYKIAGVQYPVSQHLIKSMEKRNAKLKQSTCE